MEIIASEETIAGTVTFSKYPKTDYTYSSLSKDRVELAPGQVAVPNMSRPSLAQARLGRPTTSVDETDDSLYTYSRRNRFQADCSDDEVSGNGGYHYSKETSRWNNNHSPYKYDRYPYRRNEPGIFRRAATSTGALFYWIYTFTKTVVTTTVTTVTETISPTRIIEKYHHYSSSHRRSTESGPWSKWLILLLLLPVLGYGSYYTYENFDRHALPDFTDFQLDLSEFTAKIPGYLPSLPNITLPEFNITLPNLNVSMPDINIRENLPEVRKTYREYKDIVQNRLEDAGEYVKVVGQSCVEELQRYWRGVIGT